MDIRIQCLCIDTTDPVRLAKFWQEVLGWRLEAGPENNEVVLEPPKGSPEDGVAPDLLFLRVPEEKTDQVGLSRCRDALARRRSQGPWQRESRERLSALRTDLRQGCVLSRNRKFTCRT